MSCLQKCRSKPAADDSPARLSPKAVDMSTCELPPLEDGPLHFPKDVDVNDGIPSEDLVAKIAKFPVYNAEGREVPFRSVYEGLDGEKKNHKVLVVFIRHFYCGVRSVSHLVIVPSLTSFLVMPGIREISHRRPTTSIRNALPPKTHIHRHHRLRRPKHNPLLRSEDRLSLPHIRRPLATSLRRASNDKDIRSSCGWGWSTGVYQDLTSQECYYKYNSGAVEDTERGGFEGRSVRSGGWGVLV